MAVLKFHKGRRFYYCRLGGYHYLGKDYAKASARLAELERSHHPNQPPLTVAGLITAWLGAREHSPWHEDMANTWAKYDGATLLTNLGKQQLQDLSDAMTGHSAAWTIRHVVGVAKQIWQWAYDQNWIQLLPGKVTLPRAEFSPRDLPKVTVRYVLDHMPELSGRAVRFILATGCRPGEVRSMTWADVDLDARTARLAEHKTRHRTGESRTIYLTPDALKILAEVPGTRSPREPVFQSARGEAFSKWGLRSVMRRMGVSGPQCLRHTAAQHWLDQGLKLEEVALLLGHTDAAMRSTKAYARVRNQRAIELAQHLSPPVRLESAPPAKRTSKKRKNARGTSRPTRRRSAGGTGRTRGRSATTAA